MTCRNKRATGMGTAMSLADFRNLAEYAAAACSVGGLIKKTGPQHCRRTSRLSSGQGPRGSPRRPTRA
eukprot:1055257-Pyramimonas_sp.AAC.1